MSYLHQPSPVTSGDFKKRSSYIFLLLAFWLFSLQLVISSEIPDCTIYNTRTSEYHLNIELKNTTTSFFPHYVLDFFPAPTTTTTATTTTTTSSPKLQKDPEVHLENEIILMYQDPTDQSHHLVSLEKDIIVELQKLTANKRFIHLSNPIAMNGNKYMFSATRAEPSNETENLDSVAQESVLFEIYEGHDMSFQFQFMDINTTSDPIFDVFGQIIGYEKECQELLILSNYSNPIQLDLALAGDSIHVTLFASTLQSQKIFNISIENTKMKINSKKLLVPHVEGVNVKSNRGKLQLIRTIDDKILALLKISKDEKKAFEAYHGLPEDSCVDLRDGRDFTHVLLILRDDLRDGMKIISCSSLQISSTVSNLYQEISISSMDLSYSEDKNEQIQVAIAGNILSAKNEQFGLYIYLEIPIENPKVQKISETVLKFNSTFTTVNDIVIIRDKFMKDQTLVLLGGYITQNDQNEKHAFLSSLELTSGKQVTLTDYTPKEISTSKHINAPYMISSSSFIKLKHSIMMDLTYDHIQERLYGALLYKIDDKVKAAINHLKWNCEATPVPFEQSLLSFFLIICGVSATICLCVLLVVFVVISRSFVIKSREWKYQQRSTDDNGNEYENLDTSAANMVE